MNPTHYLMLSALLFGIGAVGVLVRRNAIVVFMCIELMLNAVNLSLVTFARMHGNLDGVVIALFVMVVAAAEVVAAVALEDAAGAALSCGRSRRMRPATSAALAFASFTAACGDLRRARSSRKTKSSASRALRSKSRRPARSRRKPTCSSPKCRRTSRTT